MKGKRIHTVEEVLALALHRKAVVTFPEKTMPAAFVMAMPAMHVVKMLQVGMYEHKPKPRRRVEQAAAILEGKAIPFWKLLSRKNTTPTRKETTHGQPTP